MDATRAVLWGRLPVFELLNYYWPAGATGLSGGPSANAVYQGKPCLSLGKSGETGGIQGFFGALGVLPASSVLEKYP